MSASCDRLNESDIHRGGEQWKGASSERRIRSFIGNMQFETLVGNDKKAIFSTYLSSRKSYGLTVTYKYVGLKCVGSDQSHQKGKLCYEDRKGPRGVSQGLLC